MPSMAADKGPKFTSLKRDMGVTEAPPEKMDDTPKGPILYVQDVALPVSDEDIGKTLMADCKIVPRRVSKNKTNGKETISYDLEVAAIRFK